MRKIMLDFSCNVTDRSTWSAAREIAKTFLEQRNGDSQHTVHAIGHCHIDTAWLWTTEETKRKCVRSWSTQLGLIATHPQFLFACSQAQQFEWVKQSSPDLFRRIKEEVSANRFIPTGGTWVEMDGNLPSGESMVRQFLHGQRFFQEEFGKKCLVFWLPDTFGYSPQLPQLILQAGMKYFLSQKISWNLFNKFPHNTFMWAGLDGSSVLSHFPPADNYNSQANVKDLLHTVENNKDKAVTTSSMLLFGFGDGGGGPTTKMIDTLRRLQDLDGLPKVVMKDPVSAFEALSVSVPRLNTWHGELYLELHRGCYTTQAPVKKGNRLCETLLHDAEWLATLASFHADFEYPRSVFDSSWKTTLLNQFHDILPGSSIQQVYDDAARTHAAVASSLYPIISSAKTAILSVLLELGVLKAGSKPKHTQAMILNTLGFQRTEVVELPSDIPILENVLRQQTHLSLPRLNEEGIAAHLNIRAPSETAVAPKPLTLVCVDLPPYGVAPGGLPRAATTDVSLKAAGDGSFFFERKNSFEMRVEHGEVVQLRMLNGTSKRKVIGRPPVPTAFSFTEPAVSGNRFVCYDDIPLFWDAWDVEVYHTEKPVPLFPPSEPHALCTSEILESGPLRATLLVTRKLTSTSSLKQYISISAATQRIDFHTEIVWNEAHKILKVEFPTTIRTTTATYDCQFGHHQRSTNANTSWDAARFEVCAQRWADVSEAGFGVAVLCDCKHGFSVRDGTIYLSLLRAPKAPDANADIGTHRFVYSLLPHNGDAVTGAVHQEALALCHAPRAQELPSGVGWANPHGTALLSGPEGMLIETVKLAEDDDSVIVRMYESRGGTSVSETPSPFASILPLGSAQRVNLLEEPDAGLRAGMSWSPFEIATYKIARASSTASAEPQRKRARRE
eukprot:TRINITY_DN1343_c0_g1_i5.p1 TRINITY_DN1343_c0_g1~~TRINITY_DN1343_c0_g1_i5.p1  ORF type:complete len:899 (+),score=199.01 TRINITY_DN1343_c0_g1_i5:749-3445(+)